jgi:hypothetical protein
MGGKEDTILFLRSDRLGNSVELLYTAYLPMLMLSASCPAFGTSATRDEWDSQIAMTESPDW